MRPPRLGGNERVGVFASRSPFRPNPLGLSSVLIKSIDLDRCEIIVSGADLADGTPIYDIKPYIPYCDSHPDARGGFAGEREWRRLEVRPASPEVSAALSATLGEGPLRALFGVLAEDPRPAFHNDPSRQYGLSYAGHQIRFHVTSPSPDYPTPSPNSPASPDTPATDPSASSSQDTLATNPSASSSQETPTINPDSSRLLIIDSID